MERNRLAIPSFAVACMAVLLMALGVMGVVMNNSGGMDGLLLFLAGSLAILACPMASVTALVLSVISMKQIREARDRHDAMDIMGAIGRMGAAAPPSAPMFGAPWATCPPPLGPPIAGIPAPGNPSGGASAVDGAAAPDEDDEETRVSFRDEFRGDGMPWARGAAALASVPLAAFTALIVMGQLMSLG